MDGYGWWDKTLSHVNPPKSGVTSTPEKITPPPHAAKRRGKKESGVGSELVS